MWITSHLILFSSNDEFIRLILITGQLLHINIIPMKLVYGSIQVTWTEAIAIINLWFISGISIFCLFIIICSSVRFLLFAVYRIIIYATLLFVTEVLPRWTCVFLYENYCVIELCTREISCAGSVSWDPVQIFGTLNQGILYYGFFQCLSFHLESTIQQ